MTTIIPENMTLDMNGTDSPEIVAGGVDSWDDATWILTSSFIIFTMQSGFGLLEAGMVHPKNETNIMIKNLVDVVFGGISYWIFGYGLTFGHESGSNPFCGIGYWFVTSKDTEEMGLIYSSFIFQLSFTTTATTIVSGAMAERTKLDSYIIFSFFNTLVYCLPAHWVWADNGFLRTRGVIDFAGSGVVHMLGGISAIVSTMLLGPRQDRFKEGNEPSMGHPSNAIMGLFMLWWGWLAFNAGSTYGISGGKWKLASKAASITMLASIGGGVQGILVSFLRTKKFPIDDIINSILGALVAITASCAMVHPIESVIIGIIGGFICMMVPPILEKLKIDDPVGAFAVHGVGGLWGMLAVGIFVDIDPAEDLSMGQKGILHGGDGTLLLWQAVACLVIIVWTIATTLIILLLTYVHLFQPLKYTLGLRLSPEEELLGSDYCEHGIDTYCRQYLGEDGKPNFDKVTDIKEMALSPTDQDKAIFKRPIALPNIQISVHPEGNDNLGFTSWENDAKPT